MTYTPPRPPRDEDEYLALLQTDVHFFAEEIWKDRGLDGPAPLSWVEHDAIGWITNGEGRKRGLLAQRGFGKTHLVATLALFRLNRDPDRKIIVVSKSEDEAKNTVKLVRGWIDDIWFLRHLAPGDRQLDNKSEFDVGPARKHRQPSLRALGIEGQMPGNRAHTIIVDDIEDKTNTETIESRQKLSDRCGEFVSILYPNMPKERRQPWQDATELLEIGTFHHEDSVYLAEARRGVEFRSYPMLAPTDKERDRIRDMGVILAPSIAERMVAGTLRPGDIILPQRFDADDVASKKKVGDRYFYMQHMLIVGMGTQTVYPLRLRDIMVLDLNPRTAPTLLEYGSQDSHGPTDINDFPCIGFDNDRFRRPVIVKEPFRPYTGIKMWIDSSGKGKDLTGVAVVGYLNGFQYVLFCDGLPGGFEEQDMVRLARIARDHNAREIYVESNFGGGMFAQLLRPVLKAHHVKPCPEYPDGWTCAIVDDTKLTHATAQKEARIIDTLKPLMERHQLVFNRPVAENRMLQHQITHITYQRECLSEYGAIDALAGCAKAWAYAMSANPEERAAKQAQDDEEEREQRILRKTPSYLRDQRLKPAPNWMVRRR